MTDITMPRLSDSMEEGTLLTWLKQDGEPVVAGEELVEIETDKATMTYESPAGGVLSIVGEEGGTYAVGAVIARVGDAESGTTAALSEEPVAVAAEPGEPAGPEAVVARASTSVMVPDESLKATPLARRMARDHGVALENVRGSGPNGRIRKADVVAATGIAAAPISRGGESAGTKGPPEIVELTRLQQVIARRMAEAKATVPHFQVQMEADMRAALDLRRALKAQWPDAAPSLNDLVVKAAALALRQHPRANGSYKDGRFELYPNINVGIAVASDAGLVVPTVTDADTRSLASIGAETRRLAARVRDGQITPPELSGATFTVSNLGMFGVTAVIPVVNTPQAAILGVGTTRAVPALEHGRLVERELMTLTLSCDHRILYGADAAKFLATIRGLLEEPLGLIL